MLQTLLNHCNRDNINISQNSNFRSLSYKSLYLFITISIDKVSHYIILTKIAFQFTSSVSFRFDHSKHYFLHISSSLKFT